MSMFNRLAAAAVLATGMSAASAGTVVFARGIIDHGEQTSPASLQAVFTTSAQAATLQFRLKGYISLDGANDFSNGLDYGDYFTWSSTARRS